MVFWNYSRKVQSKLYYFKLFCQTRAALGPSTKWPKWFIMSTRNKMRKLIGTHISIAGGIYKAISRANNIDIDCMQIFTKSNRAWVSKPITTEDAQLFKAALRDSSIKKVIAHASYLINIASDKAEIEKRSVSALVEELNRCQYIGVESLVLHPGNRGEQLEKEGIKKIVENLNKVLDKTKQIKILLENTAGQGSSIAHSFENISEIYTNIEQKERIGVCFDTCHAWAAGYDLLNKYDEVWESFNEIIGLEKLNAIHLNDSKRPLGSRIDRHENIGNGYLTDKVFQQIINDQRFMNIIKILETPIEKDEFDYKRDLSRLESLFL